MKVLKLLTLFCILCSFAFSQSHVAGDRVWLGIMDATGATHTYPFKTASSLPGSCNNNEWIAIPGSSNSMTLYFCASSAWQPYISGSGGSGGLTSFMGRTTAAAVVTNADILSALSFSGGVTVPGETGSFTSGNVVTTNSSGRLVDSGVAVSSIGSGGGGGITSAASYPFGNFAATASGGTLKVGTDCASTPCQEAVGAVTYSYKWESDATANSGATDLVFSYIDSANPTGITFGSQSASITCSLVGIGTGCYTVTGISNFPPHSIPLYRWVLNNGAFSAAADFDARSNMRTSTLSGQDCIIVTSSQAGDVISYDTTNPNCQSPGSGGGSGGTFNGGTITSGITINTTDGPMLTVHNTSSTGNAGISMINDLSQRFDMGVTGSGNSSPGYMYMTDTSNGNIFLKVQPSTDEVVITGMDVAPLTVTSANTSATVINLNNTSSGGHNWANSVLGSGQSAPGVYQFYDNTTNKVGMRLDSSNQIVIIDNLQLGAANGGYSPGSCVEGKVAWDSGQTTNRMEMCANGAWHHVALTD